MTRTFSLTAAQFDAHWAGLGLGRKPYPLDVPHSRGHAEPPDEQLGSLLRLLGDHVTAVDVVAELGGPLRGLAASDGRRGVLAVVRAGQVVLTAIRPTGLAMALLSLLPEVRPGSGNALSAPLDVVRKAAERSNRASDSGHDVRAALIRSGMSRDDATLMSELATGRTAGGQFGVTHRNERASTVVTWFDTAKGRYLLVSDGSWLSVAPADNSRIAARIDTILAVA